MPRSNQPAAGLWAGGWLIYDLGTSYNPIRVKKRMRLSMVSARSFFARVRAC